MANTVKQGASGQTIENLGSLNVREDLSVWNGSEFVPVTNADNSYTISDIRSEGIDLPKSLVTSGLGGGTWVLDETDTTSADNTGTILVTDSGKRYKREYDGHINVLWFGAKGDSITDDTEAFQNCIDFCITNPARPKTMWIPIAQGGRYILTSDLVINVRDSSVSYNPARFSIIGEQGKGGRQGHDVGCTLYRTGAPGSIIRICEETDGTFPGGGKETVVNPLNFMRSVNISGLNFVGYGATTPNTITGVSGRSIDNSIIESCGFAGLNFGIRFGTGLENVANEVTTIGNVTLDYCERNLITRCSFGYVRKHIYITAPDISTITQCFFSGLINTDGSDYVLYWAAGNDYLTFSKNIVHPRTSAFPTSPVGSVIRCYSTRGVLFEENHFEGLSKKLFDLAIVEDVEVRSNLIQGVTIAGYDVDNVFNISGKEYARINIHDNNVALPLITDSFIKVAAISDTGNTKLKTINLNYYPNRATTVLGGTTPLVLTSNLDSLYIENGQAFNPGRIGRSYLFSDDTEHLRTKLISDGKPSANTDGAIMWSEKYTMFNDGGTAGNDNQRHILHPIGAHYDTASPDITGCIVLKHNYVESSLLNADLRIQMYNSSTSQRNIKGNVSLNLTAWLTSGSFATVGCTLKGNGAFFTNKVRIAKDATGAFCIIIGDITTLWSTSYVRAWIEKLSVGRSGSSDAWASGWSSSLETDLSTYADLTDTQPILQMSGYYSNPTVMDFASIPANSQVAAPFTLTVMGAEVGDMAHVIAPNTTGIIYKAVVTSTNLVTVYGCNFTTSAVDPASGSFRAFVTKVN
jgi:hypothetical protein